MKICDICKKEVQRFSTMGLGVYTKEDDGTPKNVDVCETCMENIQQQIRFPSPTTHE